MRETGHPLCVRPWASGDHNDGKQLKTGDSGFPGSPSLAQRRLWPLDSPEVGHPPFLPRPVSRRKFPGRNAWTSEPASGPAGPRRDGRPGVGSPRTRRRTGTVGTPGLWPRPAPARLHSTSLGSSLLILKQWFATGWPPRKPLSGAPSCPAMGSSL